MKRVKVAILGCCGVLGQRFVQMLNKHPIFDVSTIVDLYVGKKYKDAMTKWGKGSGAFDESIPDYVADMKISSVDEISTDIPLIFSGLPPNVAGSVESYLATKGHIVVSKAKDHRLEEDIPLIIPEVNANHLKLIEIQREKRHWDGAIICAPNCTTSIFSLPLKPILDEFGVESVILTTMQAVSGAGYPGVPMLDINDNIIPYIADEEEKTMVESRKILGTNDKTADFKVASYCCRVPVIDGHMECVFVKTRQEADAEKTKRLMREFPGTGLYTGPEKPIIVREEIDRPQTRLDRYAGEGKSPYVKGMSVTVGRIRNDEVFGLSFISLGHNTIRGGAGEAILVGELLEREGYV